MGPPLIHVDAKSTGECGDRSAEQLFLVHTNQRAGRQHQRREAADVENPLLCGFSSDK